MTEFELKHGLSQDEPGPLEPVEIAQQDDTLARTGNTARDQEMYAAGIRTGEENAKHNAAIRAGVPDGWKLVPIEPTDAMLDTGIKQHRCEQGDPWYSSPDLGEGDCRDIYAAMLNAAPAAPGVSTVAQDERQAFEAWLARRGVWPALCFEEVFIAGWNARPADAPAAGDAQAIVLPAKMPKYESDGSEYPSSESYKEGYAEGWNDAIDAAIAAQRKGDA